MKKCIFLHPRFRVHLQPGVLRTHVSYIRNIPVPQFGTLSNDVDPFLDKWQIECVLTE